MNGPAHVGLGDQARDLVASKRLLVLVPAPANGPNGPLPPTGILGTVREIRAKLASFNTASDGGTKKSLGTEILYGPGILVELPSGQDEVNQALVTLVEEDIAWPVLMRLCRTQNWALQDPSTGRIFGAHQM